MMFTVPWNALIGGGLIGLAASLLLLALGRVAGVSGIVAALLVPRPGEVAWRAAFIAGLLLSGLVATALAPQQIGISPRPLIALLSAGVLVGVGTRIGSGCTSGHGVCGVSRLSPRSVVATSVFVGTAIATVAVARWLGLPGL